MTESEQLKAARASKSLTNVISVLREEARTETANTSPPVRGEVDVFDAAVHVAAGTAGKPAAERRQALRDVQIGKSLTGAAHGRVTGKERVAARTSTRAEKLTRATTAFKDWTQDQRDAYIVSAKFEALSDKQQELLSEAFALLEDRAYEDSIGVANYDFDSPTPEVDDIVDEETEAEDDALQQFEADWEEEGSS
jgi:hypothetical protein